MEIKDIYGNVLYWGTERTMVRALRTCALKRIILDGAFLRRARLGGAQCDGLSAMRADLWGAQAKNADFAGANLSGGDMRAANFEGACFAGADLRGCDFSGAFLKNVIWDGALIDSSVFSCPSLFLSDLNTVKSCRHALFRLRGESDLALQKPLVRIQGLSRILILGPEWCLWGNRLIKQSENSFVDGRDALALRRLLKVL